MSEATETQIKHAGHSALGALSDLQWLAEWLSRAGRSAPELADRVDALTQQVWAMADVTRRVEAQIAELAAELRASR